ncbi:hypothetical protein [Sphingomonas sp. 2378]|uniref:hypothetical protein n=1 Tax=Sphingomonas sp. 2378 TaxID=1219748 RepID=UPI00311AF168
MLITAAMLAIAQAGTLPSPTPAPVVQNEITVIGRKLRDWRGSIMTKDGSTRCVTKKSTGDRDIDQIGCDAMLTCLPRFEGEFKAVLSTSRDKVSRRRMNADISQRLTACVEEHHDRLVEALADRRAGGRS